MYPLVITPIINMKQYHFLALLLTLWYSCRLSPQFLRYSEKKITTKSEKKQSYCNVNGNEKNNPLISKFQGDGGGLRGGGLWPTSPSPDWPI